MAGFETRAIWGSDPGLVSDRFRYTGVNVPPLDEEAIKRIQESAKQFAQVPLPSPSEIVAVKDIERLKAFEEAVAKQQQPVVPSALNTSQLNLEGTNPFEPGRKAAAQEWKRRIDAGEPEGSVFDRLMSVRDKAIEWDAMKQGALQPGRIAGIQAAPRNPFGYSGSQPGSPFDNMRTSQVEAALNQQKAISALENNPNVFQQLLNEVGKELKGAGAGVKELGRIAADVVLPNRNKVPDYMLDVVETPEFVEAKKQLKYFGSLPEESIAPGVLSEKQSRWLIDNRRTPIVGTGAFGSVTVPTNTKTAFKIQENKAKAFLENELNMAALTAELELGPQVYSATLQPIQGKEGRYRGITRTEAIPHRPFDELLPEEQKFLFLERNKLTEALYRGGVSNQDNHFGNILLNDATKKAVQVDSGLARDYDAFNANDLNSRLANIVDGLNESGLKNVAKDTSEIGLSLINEIRTNPSPELYAEAENFFNRSGNILMNQSRSLSKNPVINAPNLRQLAASSTLDIAGSVPLFDPEFRQAVEQGDVRKAATQVAKEYAIGTAAAPVIGAGAGLAQRLAPQTAAAVIPAAATALRIANPIAVASQLGGSSKINAAADKQAAQAQLQRAEAARKRGGRWKLPTPFGSLTIPELGISEAGGLFFR
jgi:hypothetical protein